jgi:hypothetical protein
MNRGLVIGLAGVAIGVLGSIGVAAIVGRGMSSDTPGAPAATDPAGSSSTQLPRPDDSYWTPERMRSARPAPMPSE